MKVWWKYRISKRLYHLEYLRKMEKQKRGNRQRAWSGGVSLSFSYGSMREIKFRFVENYWTEFAKIFPLTIEWITQCMKENKDSIYGHTVEEYYSRLFSNDFSNVILLQFTWLQDKNWKTYCQDDIVCHNGRNYRLILWTYKFELSWFYDTSQDEPWDFFSEDAYREAEIIGNIYEHPNLLAK